MAPNYIFRSLPLRGFFLYVSLFLLHFHIFFIGFYMFLLFFIIFIVAPCFSIVSCYALSFDKAQKYENGQDRIFFRDPRVTWLQITWIFSIVCVEMLLCWFSQYLCAYVNFIGFKSVGAMPTRNSQRLPVHSVVAPHTLSLRFYRKTWWKQVWILWDLRSEIVGFIWYARNMKNTTKTMKHTEKNPRNGRLPNVYIYIYII